MLHCSSTSYSQTSIFFTLLPVSRFYFFSFFFIFLLRLNFITYLLSFSFFYLLLIAKIPLFHSPLLSLIHIIGLLSSFIINSVLIITTKVHSTRSFRFDFIIIIIIFFFSTNEKKSPLSLFFNNVNCTRAEKFPDLISYISSLCYPIIQNSSSKNSQYDCSKEFPSP